MDEILDAVARQARMLLESDASQLFLPQPGSEAVLNPSASSGMDSSHIPAELMVDGSAAGLAYKLGKPVAVSDVRAAYAEVPPVAWEPDLPHFNDFGTHISVDYLPMPATPGALAGSQSFSQRYRGFLAVPLISTDKTHGVLTLSYRNPRQFTEEEIALAMAFADQARLGLENAQVNDASQRLAAAEERQRLAQDLHDSVAQVLYGIALGANTAKRHLASNPDTVREPLDYMASLAAAGLAEMRALIFDLQPDSLAKDGLLKAIERQVEALEARHGLRVTTHIIGEPEAPLQAKEAVYRVVREAVHNIVKHAQATCVAIEVSQRDGALTFKVVDDGTGFDTNQDYPGHLGLHSMRNRVQQLGGHLTIESSPGAGTIVAGRLPIR